MFSTSPITSKLYLKRKLILRGNLFRGYGEYYAIPPEIGKQTELKELDLSSNYIGGSIPSTFGNLSSLEYLNLSNIGLIGSIPRELCQLTNMVELSLHLNSITGEILTDA